MMVIKETEMYALTSDWWNEMVLQGHNKYSKKDIYYTLSASYAFIAMVALIQLVRIQMRVPEYGWTIQKTFHLMNFFVNWLRAVLFGSYKKVFRIKPQALEIMLLDLPGLLFFSTYTLLVLFWAEIYHQARSLPTEKLRPTYYAVNGAMYCIQIIIWICMGVSRGHLALKVAKFFLSVISFGAASGFLLYGGRLFFMLKRFPMESKGRQKKLQEVGVITAICCLCFLVRCIIVVEIVPSALVLFVLRRLPARRVSDQYQAIQ